MLRNFNLILVPNHNVMRAKTLFVIIVTVLVTIILMKNMDEVNFWIFGVRTVPKLAVLGTMFFIGAVVGFLIGRPKRRPPLPERLEDPVTGGSPQPLDDPDRDYIS